MKVALAILCSLVMILVQSTSALGSVIGQCALQKVCCCADKSHKCCAAKSSSSSESQSLPAVPVPANSLLQIDYALAATIIYFQPDSSDAGRFTFARASVLPANAISLHQRDCVYLI